MNPSGGKRVKVRVRFQQREGKEVKTGKIEIHHLVIGFIDMAAGAKEAEKPENTAFVLIVKWI